HTAAGPYHVERHSPRHACWFVFVSYCHFNLTKMGHIGKRNEGQLSQAMMYWIPKLPRECTLWIYADRDDTRAFADMPPKPGVSSRGSGPTIVVQHYTTPERGDDATRLSYKVLAMCRELDARYGIASDGSSSWSGGHGGSGSATNGGRERKRYFMKV